SDARATVLVVGLMDEGIGRTGAGRDLRSRPRTAPDESASAAAVDYVRALKSTEVEYATPVYSSKTDDDGRPLVVNEDTSEDPRTLAYPVGAAVGGIGLGLLVGGGLGIGGVLVRRRIREKRRGAERRRTADCRSTGDGSVLHRRIPRRFAQCRPDGQSTGDSRRSRLRLRRLRHRRRR